MVDRIPLVDLAAQYRSIRPEIDAAIQRVLDNTSFILGEEVARFERAFAGHVGARHCVGVSSGTSALHLAFVACGIGPGDEVIVPSFSFFATAEAVLHAGARPVFADVSEDTLTLDATHARKLVNERTKAIVPVHLYGHPADMGEVADLAREHDLFVIEDAAQAHGARWRGRPVGALGDLSCFSFYPGKNLGAYGDAGAVTGDDDQLMQTIRSLRDHGRSSKYEHDRVGFGARLDSLQAAVLDVKLRHLEAWTDARRAHAAAYNDALADLAGSLPVERAEARHVYHLYVVQVARRDRVLARLQERGIGAGVHYPVPIHQQPAVLAAGLGGAKLPVTEAACARVLSLPMYPEFAPTALSRIARDLLEVAT